MTQYRCWVYEHESAAIEAETPREAARAYVRRIDCGNGDVRVYVAGAGQLEQIDVHVRGKGHG